MARYVWQWFWDYDYLGNKYKAIYFGPRLDWMKLFKKRKKKKKKRKNTFGNGIGALIGLVIKLRTYTLVLN